MLVVVFVEELQANSNHQPVAEIRPSLLLTDGERNSRAFELFLQQPRPTVLDELPSLSGWKVALMARCVPLIRSGLGSPLPTADTPDMLTAPLTLPL